MKSLILSLTLLGAVGCSTPLLPQRNYNIGELNIVVVDKREMFNTLTNNIPQTYDPFAFCCKAYYDKRTKTAYVPYGNEVDKNGNALPDFRLLGHETWHNIAGWFHGGNAPRENLK